MKNRVLAFLLTVGIILSFTACGEDKAKNTSSSAGITGAQKATTSSTQNTTKSTSPKDLIVGNWVADDMLENGVSTMTPEDRTKLEEAIAANEQPIYIYEKDKIKSMIMGEWLISDYSWIDSQKIEITTVVSGQTQKNIFTVQVATDKLTLSREINDSTEKKTVSTVYKKFKGELPEAMRK